MLAFLVVFLAVRVAFCCHFCGFLLFMVAFVSAGSCCAAFAATAAFGRRPLTSESLPAFDMCNLLLLVRVAVVAPFLVSACTDALFLLFVSPLFGSPTVEPNPCRF